MRDSHTISVIDSKDSYTISVNDSKDSHTISVTDEKSLHTISIESNIPAKEGIGYWAIGVNFIVS